MSYKPWYEVSKGYEGCDLVPLNSGNSFKVGDVIDGDIVYKVDDGYAYLVAPAIKRFKADWYKATNRCQKDGYELPSREELEEIYDLREEIDAADKSSGKFTLACFVSAFGGVWSSAESYNNYAWALYFYSESLFDNGKGNDNFVMPVRKVKI